MTDVKKVLEALIEPIEDISWDWNNGVRMFVDHANTELASMGTQYRFEYREERTQDDKHIEPRVSVVEVMDERN